MARTRKAIERNRELPFAIKWLRENFGNNVVYDNGFMPRPPHVLPYLANDIMMAIAGAYDEQRIRKETARKGCLAAEIKAAYSRGHEFASVKLRMMYLPTVVHLGGKEIAWDSHEGLSIQTYMHVFGIACGLIGISGVAGGGDGAMAMAQKGHLEGIELVKGTMCRRLFPKAGVAGVLLAIREEAPNNYVTEEWLVRPTRSLEIRKTRLFSCGIPVLAQFFPGGDATFDEFDFWKTGTKQVLVEQLDSPFNQFQPDGFFVDPPREDREKPECWESFLTAYGQRMIKGSPERRTRKRQEHQQLLARHCVVGAGDTDAALRAVKRAFALMDKQATQIYGAPFVQTWELLNDGEKFWKTVSKLIDRYPFTPA
ncbi:MAG: hypothetical protein KDD69_07165 [Bdellovibrionales bacterium]|nr:hypothetical protein [Bdellovibrionales bacterium]